MADSKYDVVDPQDEDGYDSELAEAHRALEAIAGMKVDENTDHAQLSALCIAIARAAVGVPGSDPCIIGEDGNCPICDGGEFSACSCP